MTIHPATTPDFLTLRGCGRPRRHRRLPSPGHYDDYDAYVAKRQAIHAASCQCRGSRPRRVGSPRRTYEDLYERGVGPAWTIFAA